MDISMQKKLKAGSADSQINDKLQGLALFIVVIFPPCTCSLSPWPKAAAHLSPRLYSSPPSHHHAPILAPCGDTEPP